MKTIATRIAFPAVLALLAILILPATSVFGKASHDGWPTNECDWQDYYDPGPGCGLYDSHPYDEDGTLEGTDLTDELLGGHGDDTIYGGPAGDVIWGDSKPCCQPADQFDSVYGGGGGDYIYASHGTNYIDAGAGNDVVHAHFGRGGSVNCGPGGDLLFLSHRSEPHYRVRGCERISFAHEGR